MSDLQRTSKDTGLEAIREMDHAVPRVDIYENDNEILLLADVPGVTKDHLNIRFDHNHLVITGSVVKDPECSVLVHEYYPRHFHRDFVIPSGIDVDAIRAEVNEGVLRLHLPKSAELRTRQISVQGG